MADHVAPALEAILMVAEEPLPPALLAKPHDVEGAEVFGRDALVPHLPPRAVTRR